MIRSLKTRKTKHYIIQVWIHIWLVFAVKQGNDKHPNNHYQLGRKEWDTI